MAAAIDQLLVLAQPCTADLLFDPGQRGVREAALSRDSGGITTRRVSRDDSWKSSPSGRGGLRDNWALWPGPQLQPDAG